MIGKAVANSLAQRISELRGTEAKSYFLNVKGPELLNKYVGETEHKIREVFKNAREKAEEDVPVVIFFDEMDSLFRMRGSGISSDMEATVVAQFLSEIDGVESLENVIVIGASNRQDLIDPAVLRPGRLDLKVKVNRPDRDGRARDLHQVPDAEPAVPRGGDRRKYGEDPDKVVQRHGRRGHRQHVRRQRGEQVPRGHLRQGRARDLLLQGLRERRHDREHRRSGQEEGREAADHRERNERASSVEDMLEAVREEFKENEDLPEHHEPRRLGTDLGPQGRADHQRAHADHRDQPPGASIENVGGSGQYL